ncbi:2C-methyl-D-erythritol 2,4-cyclodiphosphate synthase [Algisphaera agarilytica]|uniref:2C-methyl-D-erythritol 2,4-cyclodiphosphate synthase n=1 Tax=Algisphaera agarilytica TaxID=1385975 RepID=A0A7X0H5Q3_9BACT|nr:2C-methyl-D-erythritol 2,4-cyclodiphosphate synthase [Algisphaera agarilytica]
MIIGAVGGDPNGNSIAGESYVVFGGGSVGSGGSLELSSLDGSNGFVLNGIDASDQSGVSVSSAGDVNGDGVADVIIGARGGDPNGNGSAGESYVVFGGGSVGSGGSLDLSSLDGSNGFVLNGIDTGDQSGVSVSSAGDVNGDGVADVIIGAIGGDPNGNSSAGESYVVYGVSVFTWTGLSGGNFDLGGNFIGGVTPGTTGGVVVLETQFGGTINGPSGVVIADRLSLGAEFGVTTLDLQANSLMQVRSDVSLDNSARLTGAGGVFAVSGDLNNAGEIDLGVSGLQVVADSLNNTGLFRGSGVVDAVFVNSANGRIEAFDQSGEMDFRANVLNQLGGLIATRGSAMRFNQGLTNEGLVSVSDGVSDLFGDVSNTGKIALSSQAVASFVGDLDQEGTLELLGSSRAIVFDTYTGSGGTTGSGTLEVLGTFSPGSSPASVEYGGNLIATGGTEIEIGGTGVGEFDQSIVAGDLTLDGELTIVLIEEFVPMAGDVFMIFDVGGERIGAFDGLDEGALVGSYDGTGLFISYLGGDGNDVTLYTIPEPGSAAVVVLVSLLGAMRRRSYC